MLNTIWTRKSEQENPGVLKRRGIFRRIVQKLKAIITDRPKGAKAIRTAGSNADRQLWLPY
ncbi:MAG: hypothetical protein ACLT6Y_07230 [Enterocloster sp.]